MNRFTKQMIMARGDSTSKASIRRERGATTVEFAVIAALVFVILFGIIEYAMLFLQEHYVANAAREGVRVGVRANNYSGYNGAVLPTAASYSADSDRETIVRDVVADYLNTFYDETEVRSGTTLVTADVDGDLTTDDDRVLIVTVTVDNLFSNLTPRLLKLLNSDSDVQSPDIIRFSARMQLEDPEEFDPANL